MKIAISILLVTLFACVKKEATENPKGLKDVFEDSFIVGTALNKGQIIGQDTMAIKIVKEHFNAIVAENCMKTERIFSDKWTYDFALADQFVDFGEKNNMFILGHTLVWHSQIPDWFFTDEEGEFVTREVLIQRMKDHIYTMVGRYKGRVHAWDVVNEAFENDGTLRKSKFFQIIGAEYIKLAFQFAHEADPNAQLYYNDYSMTIPEKQEGVIKWVKELQKDSVPLHGIGMQAHITLDSPSIQEIEKAILNFSKLDIPVMITELDITVLPWPGTSVSADVALSHEFKQEYDPYSEELPDSVRTRLNERYYQLFNLFDKQKDKINRVTLWGVNDSQSWRNYWPIETRTDYPLLFDRSYQAKPVVEKLIGKK